MKSPYFCFYFLFLFYACQEPNPSSSSIIPIPQKVQMAAGQVSIADGLQLEIQDARLEPLRSIIAEDYFMWSKKKLGAGKTVLRLAIAEDLAKAAYRLELGEDIVLTGGSYGAVALALSSLWQSLDEDLQLPKMTIADQPQYAYRSIMLDVARAWHHPETIKSIIDLCRWYKINYLHLHLTDDSAFTFPSAHFPALATQGHSYTKAQLVELNQYAYDRGVILVPELDVPGHSSPFIKKMPELFGIAQVADNPYTISMAREDTYAALEQLLEEVAAVFTHSPYLHIGGDEAFFEGMENDPATIAYLEKHQLPNLHELFLHFLIRINESVKKTGKQTIVWAGFGEEGELEIPQEVIVMLWEHTYHDPKDLLARQYPIINASFKPLYVVNNRKWSAPYIYEQWNPNRWESWAHEGDFYGEELPANEQVMGATMCAWEQGQINQLPRLRNRVASMAQQLWSTPSMDWEHFSVLQKQADRKLDRLMLPFEVQVEGLTYPDLGEGNFYEHRWFGSKLKISVQSKFDLDLQYATQRDPEAGDWQDLPRPLILSETSPLHIRALNAEGQPVGREYYQRFFRQALQVKATGLWKDLPRGSWEKLRFTDSLQLQLSSQLPNTHIRYELDGKAPTASSPAYQTPLTIRETAHFRAQLFGAQGQKVGTAFSESYYKIWEVKSLTTGKPITASNDHIRPNCAAPANNGRVTLWDMWGDHVGTENWVQVDLETVQEVGRFQVYTFWDGQRYYQYTIEGSMDGVEWTELVDYSKNQEVATPQGIHHTIEATPLRFLRINLLYNSANPGLHLVEFAAFGT